jgi:hypothetical protein
VRPLAMVARSMSRSMVARSMSRSERPLPAPHTACVPHAELACTHDQRAHRDRDKRSDESGDAAHEPRSRQLARQVARQPVFRRCALVHARTSRCALPPCRHCAHSLSAGAVRVQARDPPRTEAARKQRQRVALTRARMREQAIRRRAHGRHQGARVEQESAFPSRPACAHMQSPRPCSLAPTRRWHRKRRSVPLHAARQQQCAIACAQRGTAHL